MSSAVETVAKGALLAAAMALAGCPTPPPKSAATVRAEDLPADPNQLAAMRDELYRKGDPVSLENALVVADRALALQPNDYAAAWQGARAAFRLADMAEHDKGRRAYFGRRAADYGAHAAAVRPNAVEGPYYQALGLGYVASTKTLGALEIVPEIAKAARTAIQLDEKYDHCGPQRLLGALLLKAPGWPTSIGDPDEAMDRLSRAVQLCGDYPANRLYYGEALLAVDRPCDAANEFSSVLQCASNPEWAFTEARAHAEAQQRLGKALSKCKR
jgi:tetratricopeptide (TPR) repeat protein